MAKLKCPMPIMVNVAVYGMRFATGPELPRALSFWGRGRGTLEGGREKIGRW